MKYKLPLKDDKILMVKLQNYILNKTEACYNVFNDVLHLLTQYLHFINQK